MSAASAFFKVGLDERHGHEASLKRVSFLAERCTAERERECGELGCTQFLERGRAGYEA